MQFEIFQSKKDKKHYFRLKNNSGDVVLKSQGYSTKRTCMNGIQSVKKKTQVAERFAPQQTKSGKQWFNVVARNGQVVATSQRWDNARKCKSQITSVKKGAVKAKVSWVGQQ